MKHASIPVESLLVRLESDDFQAACRSGFVSQGFEAHAIDEFLRRVTPEFKERWNRMLADRIAGDELWLYRSSPESWASLSGVSGFALVRNGVIVDSIASMRS